MAKEVFQRTKPHVNVGTIGHIDHGKTHADRGASPRARPHGYGTKAKSYDEIAKGGTVRDADKTVTIAAVARRVRVRRTATTPTSTAPATPTTSRT